MKRRGFLHQRRTFLASGDKFQRIEEETFFKQPAANPAQKLALVSDIAPPAALEWTL
jgi:hypothetical protein